MPASNQEKESPHKITTPAVPADMGQARFVKPTSGLDREGVPASIALKGKRIKNLKMPANY